MALQSRNLVMVGLGVRGDTPLNNIQPPLRDGIHLRWAFPRLLGFPWHGFYLYRRNHRPGDPECLTREIRNNISAGTWPGFFLDVSFARISSDTPLVFTEDFRDPNEVELDLDGRSFLRFTFTPQAQSRRILITLRFRQTADIDITAFWGDIPLETQHKHGDVGDQISFDMQADLITEVLLTEGPVSLINFCYVAIEKELDKNWEPVAGLNHAICLPVRAPDYPCSLGSENLTLARDIAFPRITYGGLNRFTPGSVHNNGTVETIRGLAVVVGSGTNWQQNMAGNVLQITGDDAAYQVLTVLSSTRMVLNRNYNGITSIGRAYSLGPDPFGQLHDFLAQLVADGQSGGAMVDRLLPQPFAALGSVSVRSGSQTVMGNGTNWTSAIEGLRFRVIRTSQGVISVFQGSGIVTGVGTVWGLGLVGMELTIRGDDRSYIIAEVNSASRLRLNRNYVDIDRLRIEFTISERPIYTVTNVIATDNLTLNVPYIGITDGDLSYEFSVLLESPGSRSGTAHIPNLRPLDIVLLAALNPAIAQMIGLYWVDQRVVSNQAYDYLILADNTGLGTDAMRVLDSWIQSRYSNADGFIAFNLHSSAAPALPTPDEVNAFALPGTIETSVVNNAGSVGLRWRLPTSVDGVLLPRNSIMYHIWRADDGISVPNRAPARNEYRPLTKDRPLLIASLSHPSLETPQRPPDWPPFRLYFIDANLREGWYSYQVNGVDIFGRHSANSTPAQWFQWSPVSTPRPWYYIDPEGDRVVHQFAIGLLDKTPPPIPAAVEAFALDPNDPTVLRDNSYRAWWSALNAAAWYQALNEQQRNNLIGLRVRWRWRQNQQLQAPDTREFRIYFKADRFNALLGRIITTTAAGTQFTVVDTDIVNAEPADAYTGAYLICGNDRWQILSSEIVSPLRLRVQNIGPSDEIRPTAAPCSISIPERHRLFVDYGNSMTWQDRFHIVSYSNNWHPATDGDGRQYEVFLPDPSGPVQEGVPLLTSLPEPIRYAQIGLSAADNKRHTNDPPRWGESARWAGGFWGGTDRYGNESRIGGPAAIFRVRRERPERPVPVPSDSEKVYASPADYHSHSYYTYRWVRQAGLRTHIFRALDETLFRIDWAARKDRIPLSPTNLKYFPVNDPRWDETKRIQVTNELNVLNNFSQYDEAGYRQALPYYHNLSNDELRVLAGLDGCEQAFTQITIQSLDPDDRANEDQRGPDNDYGYQLRPDLRAYIDTLDGRATNRYFYRAAYIDGAQNRSELSLSGPPVYLPNVTPPKAPVITKIVGGDREITISWASNREPDLAEYRVYRASTAEATRDLRLMTHVFSLLVRDIPIMRPASVQWTDRPVPGLSDFWYCVVAVDQIEQINGHRSGGNISLPSQVIKGVAYDQTSPEPPNITAITWIRIDHLGDVHPWSENPIPGELWESAVQLNWGSVSADLSILIELRRDSQDRFHTISNWLRSGTTSYIHRTTNTFEDNTYRLKVRNSIGNVNLRYRPVRLAAIS